MEDNTTSFTVIKTPFMTLLHCGAPSIDDLQTRYQPILDVIYLDDKQALIQYLNNQFAGCECDSRFIDYIDEPRLIKVHNNQLIFMLVEQKIFMPSEGVLIILDEDEYELVKQGNEYWLGFQRYYFANSYGEEIKRIPVAATQVNQWQLIGKAAVDDFVKQQRLQHWHYQSIWVVLAKAKVESGVCSGAIDGSDFYIYYSCVPADSEEEARDKFIEYLEADFMSAAQIYKVKPFVESNYSTNTESGIKIIESANIAFERQKISSYSVTPYFMTSLLITPDETLISKWHCDYDYWSKRVKNIELCEFFLDKEWCFDRLLQLQKVSADDLDEFNALSDVEDWPVHYRIDHNGKTRFKKIHESFETDWQYEVEHKTDGYFLTVKMGNADKTLELKLMDYQKYRYECEGMEYIHELVKRL